MIWQNYNRIFITIVILVLSIASCYGQEYRDVVFMKNGSVIKGFYKELYPNDSIRMETIDGGYFVCALADIERIAKERTEVYLIERQPEIINMVWYKKGYRAFFEYGSWVNLDDTKVSSTSFITSHGYAFSNLLFIGAGMGIDRISTEKESFIITQNGINMPLFINLRCNILRRRISPFVDIKGGYTVLGIKGNYGTISSGVDFNITPRIGIYLSLGYYLMQIKDESYRPSKDKEYTSNAVFKLGIHF